MRIAITQWSLEEDRKILEQRYLYNVSSVNVTVSRVFFIFFNDGRNLEQVKLLEGQTLDIGEDLEK